MEKERLLLTLTDPEDSCSGVELIRSAGPAELFCFHQLNGNPEWEAVYMTPAMMRQLRDQMNKLEL